MGQFDDVYRHSLDDPEAFWGAAAEDIFWFKRWDRVLDDSKPPFYRWYPGGVTNTCYNALDRHVAEGRGDQAALIYDSPVTDTKQTFTYSELTDKVAAFAGALAKHGLGYGDRVIIYMPMIWPPPGSVPCIPWSSEVSPQASWQSGSTIASRS